MSAAYVSRTSPAAREVGVIELKWKREVVYSGKTEGIGKSESEKRRLVKRVGEEREEGEAI